ncbi:hypothetical protein PAXRUDRAFT_737133 [Paxillus rubicundulus Ve08.2h10]|uniref:Uncharacterized protein n=1 Tax=Paxillus rubicundulus Ve08.2h10 TaxID=930991 RepID=A0A0D0CGS7_9AGAM|nr:hypothetical protein PAXRUDRAFT_737133 [Paxillus rubicundulus Ve08.2h10]
MDGNGDLSAAGIGKNIQGMIRLSPLPKALYVKYKVHRQHHRGCVNISGRLCSTCDLSWTRIPNVEKRFTA